MIGRVDVSAKRAGEFPAAQQPETAVTLLLLGRAEVQEQSLKHFGGKARSNVAHFDSDVSRLPGIRTAGNDERTIPLRQGVARIADEVQENFGDRAAAGVKSETFFPGLMREGRASRQEQSAEFELIRDDRVQIVVTGVVLRLIHVQIAHALGVDVGLAQEIEDFAQAFVDFLAGLRPCETLFHQEHDAGKKIVESVQETECEFRTLRRHRPRQQMLEQWMIRANPNGWRLRRDGGCGRR